MSNNFCVIMAGGIGSRFWPLSRKAKPKQFLDILDVGRTFIQQTYDRFLSVIPKENYFVVTSMDYKELVMEQLPELNESQILLEPLRRNTAPCITYAVNKIKLLDANANIIVAPSDHVILKEEQFIKQIKNGLEFVSNNNALLTLGIKASRPETGYGYIQIKKKKQFGKLDNLYKVKTFTEKPDETMAQIFMDSGEFFWNSGIFLWSLPAISAALETHLTDVYNLFDEGKKHYNTEYEEAFIKKIYSECQGISIDYGVMEKANNVYVLTADFGWSDMGTWGSMYENKEKDEAGNVIIGDNILKYDLNNCIVKLPDEKTVVLHGLDGFIVVESNEMLLICRRSDETHIRQFVADVRIKKGEGYV